MKVTMLRSPAASLGCKLTEGQSGDVPAELGEKLVALGIATTGGKKKVIADGPKKPEIAGGQTAAGGAAGSAAGDKK